MTVELIQQTDTFKSITDSHQQQMILKKNVRDQIRDGVKSATIIGIDRWKEINNPTPRVASIVADLLNL